MPGASAGLLSGTRPSMGEALSRPSSMSTLSPLADSSLSVSPSGPHSSTASSSSNLRPYPTDSQLDRSLYAVPIQQSNTSVFSYDARSASPSNPSSSVYSTRLSSPQGKPLTSAERIPTFKREASSRSSVNSSQSSISTSATSFSTLKGSDGDSKQHFVLPPLSTVTSMSWQEQSLGQYGSSDDSIPPLVSSHPSHNAQSSLVPHGLSSSGM